MTDHLCQELDAAFRDSALAAVAEIARDEGVVMAPDVVLFIGNLPTTSLREIEGAAVRVIAYASLTRASITLNFAKDVLRDFGRLPIPGVAEYCQARGIDPNDAF